MSREPGCIANGRVCDCGPDEQRVKLGADYEEGGIVVANGTVAVWDGSGTACDAVALVTPAADLRNAQRIRPWPTANDNPVLLEPAVPLELHYLLTVGAGAPAGADGLGRLADAVRAIETGSPLAVPAAFQEAVWLSLLPLNSDEMARIWGLFPNENCRSSIAFRASPVWIDPRAPAPSAAPVTDGDMRHARMESA